jgi:hypothetical protein
VSAQNTKAMKIEATPPPQKRLSPDLQHVDEKMLALPSSVATYSDVP